MDVGALEVLGGLSARGGVITCKGDFTVRRDGRFSIDSRGQQQSFDLIAASVRVHGHFGSDAATTVSAGSLLVNGRGKAVERVDRWEYVQQTKEGYVEEKTFSRDVLHDAQYERRHRDYRYTEHVLEGQDRAVFCVANDLVLARNVGLIDLTYGHLSCRNITVPGLDRYRSVLGSLVVDGGVAIRAEELLNGFVNRVECHSGEDVIDVGAPEVRYHSGSGLLKHLATALHGAAAVAMGIACPASLAVTGPQFATLMANSAEHEARDGRPYILRYRRKDPGYTSPVRRQPGFIVSLGGDVSIESGGGAIHGVVHGKNVQLAWEGEAGALPYLQLSADTVGIYSRGDISLAQTLQRDDADSSSRDVRDLVHVFITSKVIENQYAANGACDVEELGKVEAAKQSAHTPEQALDSASRLLGPEDARRLVERLGPILERRRDASTADGAAAIAAGQTNMTAGGTVHIESRDYGRQGGLRIRGKNVRSVARTVSSTVVTGSGVTKRTSTVAGSVNAENLVIEATDKVQLKDLDMEARKDIAVKGTDVEIGPGEENTESTHSTTSGGVFSWEKSKRRVSVRRQKTNTMKAGGKVTVWCNGTGDVTGQNIEAGTLETGGEGRVNFRAAEERASRSCEQDEFGLLSRRSVRATSETTTPRLVTIEVGRLVVNAGTSCEGVSVRATSQEINNEFTTAQAKQYHEENVTYSCAGLTFGKDNAGEELIRSAEAAVRGSPGQCTPAREGRDIQWLLAAEREYGRAVTEILAVQSGSLPSPQKEGRAQSVAQRLYGVLLSIPEDVYATIGNTTGMVSLSSMAVRAATHGLSFDVFAQALGTVCSMIESTAGVDLTVRMGMLQRAVRRSAATTVRGVSVGDSYTVNAPAADHTIGQDTFYGDISIRCRRLRIVGGRDSSEGSESVRRAEVSAKAAGLLRAALPGALKGTTLHCSNAASADKSEAVVPVCVRARRVRIEVSELYMEDAFVLADDIEVIVAAAEEGGMRGDVTLKSNEDYRSGSQRSRGVNLSVGMVAGLFSPKAQEQKAGGGQINSGPSA